MTLNVHVSLPPPSLSTPEDLSFIPSPIIQTLEFPLVPVGVVGPEAVSFHSFSNSSADHFWAFSYFF